MPSPIGICPDPYCRICKDETGEIRDRLDDDPAVFEHSPWVLQKWREMGLRMIFEMGPNEMFRG